MKTELAITGMHCASCSTLLQKALGRIDGVSEAVVNYGTERATVEHAENVTIDDMITIIKKKGYNATSFGGQRVVEEKSERKEMKQVDPYALQAANEQLTTANYNSQIIGRAQ